MKSICVIEVIIIRAIYSNVWWISNDLNKKSNADYGKDKRICKKRIYKDFQGFGKNAADLKRISCRVGNSGVGSICEQRHHRRSLSKGV